jgi:UDP-GlcNAc3NAcA epimerase
VHTGQHNDYEMSGTFFQGLEMPTPDVSLGVRSGSHADQTGAMLKGIEYLLLKERPDWLLVYGDTNSALAGAMAASKVSVPLAHIEAGLRSFNRRMPEEINRVVADHLAYLDMVTFTASARLVLTDSGGCRGLLARRALYHTARGNGVGGNH